jgi:hypothetical protein
VFLDDTDRLVYLTYTHMNVVKLLRLNLEA